MLQMLERVCKNAYVRARARSGTDARMRERQCVRTHETMRVNADVPPRGSTCASRYVRVRAD
eukprot:2058853-Pleurochrysis_carterae.AAC.1